MAATRFALALGLGASLMTGVFADTTCTAEECDADQTALLQAQIKEVKEHEHAEAAVEQSSDQEEDEDKEVQEHTVAAASEQGTCTKTTGGTCSTKDCDASRGPTVCAGWGMFNRNCECQDGYCAVNGVCILDYLVGFGAEQDHTYCVDNGEKYTTVAEAFRSCSSQDSCGGVYHPGNDPEHWFLCAGLETLASNEGSTVTPKSGQ
eukprot:gb/GFBE01083535.1/.p1 GENE.gb/GFBE01083535.1/~~gb/GFBE01083535.1/.p1  ORF type:complete len:206 (+),score=49.82 gb/GFBE01083535.1/:1-618(+)